MTQVDPTSDTTTPPLPLDIDAVRHPAEPSRFALAVTCVMAVLIALVVWLIVVDVSLLVYAVLVLVGLLLGLWVAVQFWRVRLLGDAVLVTAQSLPALQSAVDRVRATLGYQRRVDIFVVPNLSPRIQLTSYFGVRALLIEGGAVADITAPATQGQLLFLLGTYFGAFKAKHDRWALAELVLDNAGVRTLLAPFVAPWLRTTVYTGDQIAYSCTRDLRVSLAAVYRVLIGRELSDQLAAPGLVLQSERVARSRYMRMAEMFRPVPHTTNRFLNLLRFADEVDPEAARAFRAELPDDVAQVLDRALARTARSARRTASVVTVTVAVPVLSLALLLAVILPAFIGWQATPGAVEDPVDTSEVDTVDVPPSPTEVLTAAVPAEFSDSCAELSTPTVELSKGLVAAVECSSTAVGGADWVEVYAYDSPASLEAATDDFLMFVSYGDCLDGARSEWLDGGGAERGVLACYYTDGYEEVVAVWTYDADAVMVLAADAEMFLDEMYAWWQTTSPTFAFQ